jgi:Protein of unknown function (DUF2384)
MANGTSSAVVAVPLTELHNVASGRIDARRVADYLGVPLSHLADAVGVSYPAVHKTPDAMGLQRGLGPIKRSLSLLSRVAPNKRTARAWLNSPHPDLGEKTPLEVMLSGHADAVVGLLENAIAGLPS